MNQEHPSPFYLQSAPSNILHQVSGVKALNVDNTLSDLPEDLRKELEPLLDTWPENLNRRLREAGRPELQHCIVNGQTEFPPMLPADWYFCAQIVKTLPSQKVQYSEW